LYHPLYIKVGFGKNSEKKIGIDNYELLYIGTPRETPMKSNTNVDTKGAAKTGNQPTLIV